MVSERVTIANPGGSGKVILIRPQTGVRAGIRGPNTPVAKVENPKPDVIGRSRPVFRSSVRCVWFEFRYSG